MIGIKSIFRCVRMNTVYHTSAESQARGRTKGPADRAAGPKPCRLFCVFGAAGFADDVYADLTGIFQLLFDALGHFLGQHPGAVIGDILGLDHDAHLAAGLDGKALLHAGEGIGDLLQLFQALDVVFQALAARVSISRTMAAASW